ncbi:MAG: hypothetical protein M1834_007199 [Cirrosporium novae-zelandiae]|nr:MAG: hypothetical protein M1834_007199 [Cirrosporium novae-zelandiae]
MELLDPRVAANAAKSSMDNLRFLTPAISFVIEHFKAPYHTPVQFLDLGEHAVLILQLKIEKKFPKAEKSLARWMAEVTWDKAKELQGRVPQDAQDCYICPSVIRRHGSLYLSSLEEWKDGESKNHSSYRWAPGVKCPFCLDNSFSDKGVLTDHVYHHLRKISGLIMPLVWDTSHKRTDESFEMSVKVWNRKESEYTLLSARMDSGSDYNLISLHIVEALGLKIECLSKENHITVRGVTGESLSLKEVARPQFTGIKWRKTYFHVEFYIIENLSYDILLGRPFIDKYYPDFSRVCLVAHECDKRARQKREDEEKAKHDKQRADGEKDQKQRKEDVEKRRHQKTNDKGSHEINKS